MITGISGFISGVILLYFCTEFINTSLYSIKNSGFFIAASIVLASIFSLFVSRSFHRPAFFVVALTLGFAYAFQLSFDLKEAILPYQYDKQTMLLEGFLCGLPKESAFSVSADFCLTSMQSMTGQVLRGNGYKAQIRWPLAMSMPLQPVLITASVRQPRSTLNFSGFAYEKHLFYQGVVSQAMVHQVLEYRDVSVLSPLQRIQFYYHQARLWFAQFSEPLLDGLQHHGVIRALLLGDRSRLSPEDARLLTTTGTQHLIAISGLHVGIVMLGLYLLLPKSSVTLLLIALLGAVYVLLVGFSPSAQRAWVMCLLGLLYITGFLKYGRWHIYLLALFTVLLLDPLAPLSLGFWFSFICVAILMLMASGMQVSERPWITFLQLQFLLMLGLAPVYSESGLPNGPANVLANLLAVPWVSILILPLVLSGFFICLLTSFFSEALFEFSRSVFFVLDTLIECLMAFLASLDLFSNDWLFESRLPLTIAYLLCFMAVLLFYRFTVIRLVLLPAMMIVLLTTSRLQEVKNEFLVFDAGQGLAIAMSFDGQTWLFDTGPVYGRLSTVDQVIMPYLRSHRLLSDTVGLIVSHGDADHASGVSSLVEVLDNPVLVSGEPDRLDSVRRFQLCHSGMRWDAANASLEVLYPFHAEFSDISGFSSNNHSCVLRFQLAGKRFLLMGDLETAAELALVRHYRHLLKADVLIAGHHGAAGSSSYALLKHVRPDYVVFSAGYANTFGHPSISVLERIDKLRSSEEGALFQVLNTAQSGALRFEVDNPQGRLRVLAARQEKNALWVDGYHAD